MISYPTHNCRQWKLTFPRRRSLQPTIHVSLNCYVLLTCLFRRSLWFLICISYICTLFLCGFCSSRAGDTSGSLRWRGVSLRRRLYLQCSTSSASDSFRRRWREWVFYNAIIIVLKFLCIALNFVINVLQILLNVFVLFKQDPAWLGHHPRRRDLRLSPALQPLCNPLRHRPWTSRRPTPRPSCRPRPGEGGGLPGRRRSYGVLIPFTATIGPPYVTRTSRTAVGPKLKTSGGTWINSPPFFYFFFYFSIL